MVELEQKGGIFIMYLPRSLTTDIIVEIQCNLDKIEYHSGPTALIFASKTPKIFCAGMDLKFMLKNGINSGIAIFTSLMKLFGRLLKFGVPTIAAINGHAVAGGLLIALALDYRVMSSDVGSAKMTEITLGMSLPRGGDQVLASKLAPDVHRDLILRAKSFTPQECLDKKIVDYLVPYDNVLDKAIELAKELIQFGEKKKVYEALKTSIYYDAITICQAAAYSSIDIDALFPKI
jgi:Delta3-Delta2-enoyl-CoA isomerase